MNVVALNSKNEYETTQNQGNHIIHIRVGNTICRRNSKEGKQKERCHGGDWHRHGLSEPPREDPG